MGAPLKKPHATMHRSRPITIPVLLPPADYRVFVSATRLLRRSMCAQAPDVPALIRAQLVNRDPTGLAEDYLDLVDWPPEHRRPIFRMMRKPRTLPRLTGRASPPADPSRN